MDNTKKQVRRLYGQREQIVKGVNLAEMIRGTMLKRYLECARQNCRCHKGVKERHGPYYFLAIRRKDKTKHVYIPQDKIETVKKWVSSYNKIWQGIEEITDINVKLIRMDSK